METKAEGNKKRIQSCKDIGKNKKLTGHKREQIFNKQYNKEDIKIEYGATADAVVENNEIFIKKINDIFNCDKECFNISIKSGKNLQFVLGNIPELLLKENLDWIKVQDNCKELFEKYLKKTNSSKPADLLVYFDNTDKPKWLFFKMDDVINFIVENTKWRKLDSGRIKGDIFGKQYLTYEYRNKHKSHFLGLNGNRGLPFIELLKLNIKFYEDYVEL